jgi:FKBP-type peptidyl-prolyl cis-trans isomerase FkpA
LSAQRRALAAFGGLALFELVETFAYLWIRADDARLAEVAEWFGLDLETQMVRVNILLPVASVLAAFACLVYLGVRGRARGALRWRRTAFFGFGLYALWALSQQVLLAAPALPARVWLLTVTVVAGGLGTLGYVAAGRALAGDDEEPSFVVYDPISSVQRLPSGLEWQDVDVGQGPLASPGRTAVVHYTGWLTNGRKFDSSRDRGKPFEFPVGAGRVIRGWDEGVQTMRQGGRRRLIVPPQLGYGGTGAGAIPPNATLVFDVELVDVR